jgi:nucleoside-diphosphate-sugar epimerase
LKKTLLILITGACGFIGKNLVEGLLKKKNLIIGTYYIKKDFVKNSKVKYIQINSSNFFDFNKNFISKIITFIAKKLHTIMQNFNLNEILI